MVINKCQIVKSKIDYHIAWKKAEDCFKFSRAKPECECLKQAIDETENYFVS